jgi:hypothetical protein
MTMAAYFEIAIGLVCLALLCTAALAFWKSAIKRIAIEAALKSPRRSKPLGTFSLTGHRAIDRLAERDLVVPEKLWTYDGFYLERFARAANRVHLPGGGTALHAYSGSALNWDMVFAVCLGLFVTLAEAAVATLFLSHGWPSEAMLFFACMGFVYGAADFAEDFKLSSIFEDWERDEKAARTDSMAPEHPAHEKHDSARAQPAAASNALVAYAEDGLVFDERGAVRGHHRAHIGKHEIVLVDGGEAAAANALTRIKFVAIIFSILGALIYLIFTVATMAIPHQGPTATAAPSNGTPTPN